MFPVVSGGKQLTGVGLGVWQTSVQILTRPFISYDTEIVCNHPVRVFSIFKMFLLQDSVYKSTLHSAWHTVVGQQTLVLLPPSLNGGPDLNSSLPLTVIFFSIVYPSSVLHSAPQRREQLRHLVSGWLYSRWQPYSHAPLSASPHFHPEDMEQHFLSCNWSTVPQSPHPLPISPWAPQVQCLAHHGEL